MNKYPNIQLLILLLLLIPFGHAAADIAPNPKTGGGTISNLEGEATDVRMVEEDVLVRIFEDEIITVAEFAMRNEGEAVNMEVGFPSAYQGDFIEFRAYINEREVDVADWWEENDGRKKSTVYWKLWNMTFEKGESYDIRVEYKTKPYEWFSLFAPKVDYPHISESEYEEISTPTIKGWATYGLGTGKPWKGKLDRCRVAIELDGKSSGHIKRFWPEEGRLTGEGVVWEYIDYEPTGDLNIEYFPNMAVEEIPPYLLGIIEKYPDDARIATDIGNRISSFGRIDLECEIYRSFLARWDKPIPQLMEYASGGRCRFNFGANRQFYLTWRIARVLFSNYERYGGLKEAADIAPVVSRISGAIVDSLDTCGNLPQNDEHLYRNAKELLFLSNSLIDEGD